MISYRIAKQKADIQEAKVKREQSRIKEKTSRILKDEEIRVCKISITLHHRFPK